MENSKKCANKNVHKLCVIHKTSDSKTGMRDNFNSYKLSIFVTNKIIASQFSQETIDKNDSSKTIYENLNEKLNILTSLILILSYIIPIVNTTT